jgi:S1-C subfamily serine protease
MSWVDIFVIVLALLAAISGWRHGLAVALLSFVGVIGGAVLGVRAAPLVAQHVQSPTLRVMVSIGIVVLLVAIGETTGVYFGRRIRDRITGESSRAVDSTFGSILQALTVLLAAWLVALPLAQASFPALARGIQNSVVLAGVDNAVGSAFPSAHDLPSELRALLDSSGFPGALSPFAPNPTVAVGPPNMALSTSAGVTRVKQSVLKIRGKATQCSRALEGSGFVISDDHVITNAHVVAGTAEVSIVMADGGGRSKTKPARVVYFNSDIDVAVLYVPGLDLPSLTMAPRSAAVAADAVVLGYPLDGPFKATPARIRGQIDLSAQDIYNGKAVVRDVYEVRSVVRSGNSGGPLIAPDGTVYGIIFSEATNDPDTGYALTAPQIMPALTDGANRTASVSTHNCSA